MSKRAYRAVLVKHVELEEVKSRLKEGPLWAGVDVAKSEALVVIRDSTGAFERPWKVKLPGEIRELVSQLQSLRSGAEIKVAMESTGTYGEALRQALTDAELAVERVRSQATSDYAEIFDGVPSQHDGKDAAMLAELGAIGKSVSWPSVAVSEGTARLKAQVQWMTAQQEIWQTWLSRLEGLVSKFWPEATGVVSLQSVTLLRVLKEYGGPRGLAADDQAAKKLASWGRRLMTSEKIVTLLESARTTLGVRLTVAEEEYVKQCAQAACEAGQAVKKAQKQLEALSRGHAVIERMAESVGRNTACVLFVMLGDPHEYHCGAAYRKAMGLNLKERSSGKHQGQLKITKRGPSLVRRWLYFAALRWVQKGPIRTWFEAKKKKDKDRGLGGIVAVMRKLALAVHATVINDEPFLISRLFPGKPIPRQPVKDKAPIKSRKPTQSKKVFGPKPKDFERHDSDVQCASDRTAERPSQDASPHSSATSLTEKRTRSASTSSVTLT